MPLAKNVDSISNFPVPQPCTLISPEQFRFVYSRVNCFCLDLVVASKEGILLSMRTIEPHKGYWVLPGGVLMFKEMIPDAINRLAKKELGVKCIGYRELGHIQHIEDGPWRSTISLVVLIDYSGHLQGCDEGAELKIFSEFGNDVQPYQAEFLKKNFDRILAMQGS